MKLGVKHLQLFKVQTQLKNTTNESPKYMPSYMQKYVSTENCYEKIVSMENMKILETKFFFI
jgi:hypothetical protein